MTDYDDELRSRVAGQLDYEFSPTGPLAANGPRASIRIAANYRRAERTTARDRLWSQMTDRYLARQPDVAREGRAALLTAGVPGAGKSRAVDQLGDVDEGWRRLDADVVKDYLIEDLVAGGHYDDVLAHELADGYPIMPAELATLVHMESVTFLDELQTGCLERGENVVIEGTLSWPPAAQQLLRQLVTRDYREVLILDVEVPRALAHEQALNRWWEGRQERIAGRGLGGRFVPPSTIDRAFPSSTDTYSVCAINVRAAFDSATAHALPVITLRVLDSTGPTPVVETHERRSGVLQPRPGPQQLSLDTDVPVTAAQLARHSFPRGTVSPKPTTPNPVAGTWPPRRPPPSASL